MPTKVFNGKEYSVPEVEVKCLYCGVSIDQEPLYKVGTGFEFVCKKHKEEYEKNHHQ